MVTSSPTHEKSHRQTPNSSWSSCDYDLIRHTTAFEQPAVRVVSVLANAGLIMPMSPSEPQGIVPVFDIEDMYSLSNEIPDDHDA